METVMYEITNTCSCVYYDNEEEAKAADDCFGLCWEDSVTDMEFMLIDWFDAGEFRIDGFPVWYGTIGGYFDANTVTEFIDRITPDRTDWSLRYTLEGDEFVGFLSHHDGSGKITVKKVS